MKGMSCEKKEEEIDESIWLIIGQRNLKSSSDATEKGRFFIYSFSNRWTHARLIEIGHLKYIQQTISFVWRKKKRKSKNSPSSTTHQSTTPMINCVYLSIDIDQINKHTVEDTFIDRHVPWRGNGIIIRTKMMMIDVLLFLFLRADRLETTSVWWKTDAFGRDEMLSSNRRQGEREEEEKKESKSDESDLFFPWPRWSNV